MTAESLFATDEPDLAAEVADLSAEAEREDAPQETQEDTSEQEAQETAEVPEGGPAKPEEPAKEPERVPLAALLDERRQRQDLTRELQEQREYVARLDERLDHITKATQPEVPLKDEDPVGYMEHLARQTQDRIKPLEQNLTAQQEVAEQQAAINDIAQKTQAYEAQFMAQTPDYNEAVDFMRQQAAERYKIMNVPLEQIPQLLHRDSMTLAHSALMNNQDPAEVAYKMAGLSGYKKTETTQETASAKLEAVQKGQDASKSLSGAGGEGTVALTLEALADMDDDDFDKISDNQWRKLVASG